MPKDAANTKKRIILAANQLFYLQGIKGTSVDAIAAKAKVTKRTLYYHFRSKEELISAYLNARDEPNTAAFKQFFAEEEGDIDKKIAALFYGAARAVSHPSWRGCGYQRTLGELANQPGHPAFKIGAAHKKNLEQWLGETLASYRLTTPQALAKQLCLLIEGALAAMLIHKDLSYFDAAAEAAKNLIVNAQRVSEP